MSDVAAPSEDGGHVYRAFGLTLRSAVGLPELRPGEAGAAVDVEIACGAVPDELPGVLKRGVRYQTAAETLRLQVDGVATYLVEAGRRITIARAAEAADEDVRVFLLGPVLGALLHQRGELVLHGCAIAWEGKAVVFLGRSGAGKSTLAAAFRQRGRAVLTDDLCVVCPGADGRIEAQPGYPQMKLWLDSLKRLGIAAEALPRVRPKLEKRMVALDAAFHPAPLPVDRLYLLVEHNKPEFKLEPAKGPQKFRMLRNHTYRFGSMAHVAFKAEHFKRVHELAQQVPLASLVRPMAGFKIDELVERIEGDLRA